MAHFRFFVILGLAAVLGACSSKSGVEDVQGAASGTGSSLKNLFLYGGTTVPPSMKLPLEVGMDCPPATIPYGGAQIRNGGDGLSTVSQISLTDVVRECVNDGAGNVRFRTGVEGSVLLGPAGRAGNFAVPITWELIKGNNKVLQRTAVVNVSISAGQTRADFRHIFEDTSMKADPYGDYGINVSLGKGAAVKPAKAQKRKKRG